MTTVRLTAHPGSPESFLKKGTMRPGLAIDVDVEHPDGRHGRGCGEPHIARRSVRSARLVMPLIGLIAARHGQRHRPGAERPPAARELLTRRRFCAPMRLLPIRIPR